MINNYSYSAPKNFLRSVYAWMAAGLSVTAGIAYFVAQTPALLTYLFSNPWVIFALVIAQFAFVLTLSLAVRKLSYPAAAALFLGYSALTGLTLSSVFLVYTFTSIAVTFVVAAAMFLAMAIYGFVTDADLSSMGSFLLMGIIGLIIAGIVNMFLKSTGLEFIIAGAGVIIFALLTAYDVQKLKVISYQLQGSEQRKLSIIGALTLYLDFINLFLYLLRFLGQKKDNR